jgi:hypothetical protein
MPFRPLEPLTFVVDGSRLVMFSCDLVLVAGHAGAIWGSAAKKLPGICRRRCLGLVCSPAGRGCSAWGEGLEVGLSFACQVAGCAVLHCAVRQAPDLCQVELEQCRRALDADPLADKQTQRIGWALCCFAKRTPPRLCARPTRRARSPWRARLAGPAHRGLFPAAAAFPGLDQRVRLLVHFPGRPRDLLARHPSRGRIVTRPTATGARPTARPTPAPPGRVTRATSPPHPSASWRTQALRGRRR